MLLYTILQRTWSVINKIESRIEDSSLCFHMTNAMLVCILLYVTSAVILCLFLYVRGQISRRWRHWSARS